MSHTELFSPEISELASFEYENPGRDIQVEDVEEEKLLQRLSQKRQSLQRQLAERRESDSLALTPLPPSETDEPMGATGLHERLKRRLSTMRERAEESLFDGEGRKEDEGTLEPERVLKGQRGEPKERNRFQQLAALARRSDGRKEDVEMNLLTKPARILPPISSEASFAPKSPVVSFQNEQAEISIATDHSEAEYIDTVFSRHDMDVSVLSEQTIDDTGGHRISPAISETSIARSEEDLEDTPLLTPQSTVFLSYTGPKYRPTAERIASEKSVTFNKTGVFATEDRPVGVELRKEPGTQVRDAQEEGLYVPEVLAPPNRTLVAMEHRIVRERALNWFGENGQLKGLSGKFQYSNIKKGDFPDREELFYPPDTLVDYSPPLNIPPNERNLVISNTHQQDPIPPSLYLSLYLSSLRFLHHALFSQEHMLCTRLYSLQLQYNKMRERESSEMYYRRLQALRRQLRSLRVELDRLSLRSLTGREVEQKTNDIGEIKREIIEFRQLRSVELEKEQTMLKSILTVWGQLKQLRQEQSYVSTAARLRIKRETIANVEEDKLNFMTELEQELIELREEFEEKLSSERINYEVEYDQWRRDQETRQELMSESQTSGISFPLDIPPPAAPSEFEEGAVRRRLEEQYLAERRHPGQPILTPELYLNMPLTGVVEDQREVSRRRDVEKLSYFLRVKVNGETVCETKHRKLKQDFITDFQEHFQLQLRQKPDSIILEVYQSSFTHTLLAEVPYPIPSSIPAQKPASAALFQALDFAYEKVFPPRLGVGACVPLRGRTLPYTTGVVNASLELYGQHVAMSERNEWGGFGKFTKLPLDAGKIRASLASARLDPNDPRNFPLLQLLRSLPSEDCGDAFTLTRMDMVRPFLAEIDFNSNPAFKHFEERHRFELSPTRSIRFEDELTRQSPVGTEEHPEDTDTEFTPWHHGMESFYQSVRRELTKQAKGPDYSLEEVVIEDPVPNITILRNNLAALFSPKRPLQPKRVPRRTLPSKHANIRQLNLVVRVLQGYNFPSRVSDSSEVISRQNRSRTATSLWRESSSVRGVGMVDVDRREEDLLSCEDDTSDETQPFIEVRFQGTTYRTKQSLGVNPNWNEELLIPYHPPTPTQQTFSADSLISSSDVIYFNAFDLVRVDALEDERLRATNVQERLDYRWLGSFQIPFHTILINSRIDGTFKVKAPRILFGYEREGRMENTDMQLSMFITLDPLIKPQKSIYAALLDKDDKKLIEKFKNETFSLTNDFPDRIFTINVGDIHGRQVLVNRYIAPLNPPDIFIPFDDHCTLLHLERISRFVSLIPFLPDSQCLEGLSDVWVPTEEFLKLRCGDEEEHATLLLNYFLFLNVESWLVLGFAVPEGSTAYVLSKDKFSSSLRLWNPSTGESFSISDTNCPLLHIYTIASAKKIHFNTQASTKPSDIDYNFSNSRKWKTCILPDWIMQYSLQPSELVYAPPDSARAYKLKDMIRRQLQLQIESWRSRLITQWNLPAGAMLGEHLVKFEESYPDLPEAELKQAFQSLFITYQIVGFPIHLTPTSFKGFEEQVYATGIHTCQEPGVEFVIACYVHPYPNEIFSIWLYLATMIPK